MSPIEQTPELNPELNRDVLAKKFSATGRVHIRDVLTASSAERLHYALERETPWRVNYNVDKEAIELHRISGDERQKLMFSAWDRARTGFQYLYQTHTLTIFGEPYGRRDHYFAQLVDFLSAPPLLDFIREVTGLDAVAWTSAQATLYQPLDFLNTHDDQHAEYNRLVAFVLNMTRNWRPDWGGALQFIDDQNNIEEGYLPTFNALNLFRVPKRHLVSQVTPFGGQRYSVAGWFHARRTAPQQASEHLSDSTNG